MTLINAILSGHVHRHFHAGMERALHVDFACLLESHGFGLALRIRAKLEPLRIGRRECIVEMRSSFLNFTAFPTFTFRVDVPNALPFCFTSCSVALTEKNDEISAAPAMT
ncbi:MAG TPA: hypothetical protein VFB75_08705 [Burkholderiales bacterium]|nr:hypothetical protein [Burkholderiales bacterium]